MRTEDVLEQIDSALDDWDVGPDAMRCNAPAGAPAAAVEWGLVVPRRWAVAARPFVRFTMDMARFESFMRRYAEAARRFAVVMIEMGSKLDALLARTGGTTYDEHHPRPLSIDGHAYRRRVRGRRGR